VGQANCFSRDVPRAGYSDERIGFVDFAIRALGEQDSP